MNGRNWPQYNAAQTSEKMLAIRLLSDAIDFMEVPYVYSGNGRPPVQIADMLKGLLQIGLIAVIILIALDLMLLSGDLIYSLILGFVIIGAGIALTDGLIKSITDDHKEFVSVAGYAKFVLYSIFLIIGAGAIFSTFEGVTNIVANVSWAFAIAMGIVLIPVIYTLAKRMAKES